MCSTTLIYIEVYIYIKKAVDSNFVFSFTSYI